MLNIAEDTPGTSGRRMSPITIRTLILVSWAVLIACVAVGSLLSAQSAILQEIGRLHISDKLEHFGAYLALSALPVIGFRDRRRGIVVGLSMFLLSVVLEELQHFSPGRAVETGDVIANLLGVGCGTLVGLPTRTAIQKQYSGS